MMVELTKISISPSPNSIAVRLPLDNPKTFTDIESLEKYRNQLINEYKTKGWESPVPYFNYSEIEI
jgi:hypothetical protein